jgi:lantibiotic modifying enzyme
MLKTKIPNTIWDSQFNHFGTLIMESMNSHGWLCGVPLFVETPSLMVGLAGIGYELLRFGTTTNLPSILLLEPPLLVK